MKEVINIIKQLQNTSSSNEKLNILKLNKDNELLQKVLEYTYNPFKKYGMSEKSISLRVYPQNNINDIFEVLDKLSKSNINDSLRITTNSFLSSIQNKDEQELYKMMILKDLKIGMTSKSINKVWKGLIPDFNVMLAKKYFDNPTKVEGKQFQITSKMDGARFILMKSPSGKVECRTRQGQLIDGLFEFEHDFKLIPNNTVIDGEILLNKQGLHSKDLYRETMKEFRKKGEKHNLILNAFDILPYDEFIKGKSKENSHIRKQQLHQLLSSNKFTNIVEVPVLYEGKDINMINKYLDKITSKGGEGVMINISNEPYKCTRTDVLLKVKKMQSVDLKVIGFEEGTGNLSGTLGRINVTYKGNIVGVGSGFELSMRDEIWNNKDKYLDKIAEIQYFEETSNQKDDKLSLRFPVFKDWRFDKDEESYN